MSIFSKLAPTFFFLLPTWKGTSISIEGWRSHANGASAALFYAQFFPKSNTYLIFSKIQNSSYVFFYYVNPLKWLKPHWNWFTSAGIIALNLGDDVIVWVQCCREQELDGPRSTYGDTEMKCLVCGVLGYLRRSSKYVGFAFVSMGQWLVAFRDLDNFRFKVNQMWVGPRPKPLTDLWIEIPLLIRFTQP